jgi:hypothetical protein
LSVEQLRTAGICAWIPSWMVPPPTLMLLSVSPRRPVP